MKKQLSIGTLALAMGLSSAGAWGLSDKEVEKRLDRLEKKVKNVNRRSEKRFHQTNSQISKFIERVKINGFFSAGISTADEDNVYTAAGNLTDSENHTSNAIAGLQFDFTINDKTNAVLQLTASGLGHKDALDAPGNVLAEWAYINYNFSENLNVRAGRLRLPFYLSSEYVEVGYAYPWVSPPGVVYGLLPFDSYYGTDLTYNFTLAGIEISYQGYRGTVDLDLDIGAFSIKSIYGNALTFQKGPYTFRTSYTKAKIQGGFNSDDLAPDFVLESPEFQVFANTTGPAIIAAQVTLAGGDPGDVALAIAGTSENDMYLLYLATIAGNGDPVAGSVIVENEFASVEDFSSYYFDYALVYNDHGWNIIAEGSRYASTGNLQDYDSHYISIAKQLGVWTPYAVFGEAYSTTDSDFGKTVGNIIPSVVNGLGFQPFNHRETTIGVRWDFAPGVALKLETQNLTRFKGTRGLLATPPDDNSYNIYSLAIDAVF